MSGGTPPVCEVEPVGGDGLIDPEQFVIASHALPAAASQIEAAGDYLTRMGEDLKTAMDDISHAWWRLPGCYEAPEAAQVYLMLNPACDAAGQSRAALMSAATFLTDFAEAVRDEREPLRDLSARATQFRRDVIDGVWIDASESANPSFWDMWNAGSAPERQVLVNWTEDFASVAMNTALLEEHAAIAHRINAAAVTCADGINRCVEHLPADFVAPEVIPEWALASPDLAMPWGYPVEEDRNWLESLGHVPWRFGHEFGTTIAGLTGYDTLTDHRSADFAGQAWGGLFNGIGSLLFCVVGAPLVISAANVPEDERAGWMQWLVDRGEVTAAAVGGMAAIDYQAGPGNAMFHDWEDDPVAAGGYTVVNVLSLFAGVGFLSVGRAAATAARVGAMGTRTARIVALAGQLGEFAIPAAEIFTAGGLRLFTGLRTAVRLGEFDGVSIRPSSFVDDVARITDNDAPQAIDPVTPVSDDFFGTGRPDGVATDTPNVADDLADAADEPAAPPDGDPADGSAQAGTSADVATVQDAAALAREHLDDGYDTHGDWGGTPLPAGVQTLVDDGILHLDDDGVLRISETGVEFNLNANDPFDFADQLAEQQQGLSELTPAEYLQNRDLYLELGREGIPDWQAAAREVRLTAIDELADNLMEADSTLSLDEAMTRAADEVSDMDATHLLDMIAGGDPTRFSGLGSSSVNRSIGAQWRYRIDALDAHVMEQINQIPPSLWNDVRLDVELAYS